MKGSEVEGIEHHSRLNAAKGHEVLGSNSRIEARRQIIRHRFAAFRMHVQRNAIPSVSGALQRDAGYCADASYVAAAGTTMPGFESAPRREITLTFSTSDQRVPFLGNQDKSSSS